MKEEPVSFIKCYTYQCKIYKKPVSLDLLLFGDDYISYDENIGFFILIHNYIVISKRLS